MTRFGTTLIQSDNDTSLIYIDRHLVHEVTSPQAFEGLREAGRKVHAPNKTIAVPDPTWPQHPIGQLTLAVKKAGYN